jgi:tetratricopeptide (TPR) repeat protein
MTLVFKKDARRAWARRRLWLLTMELALATLTSWAVGIITSSNGQPSFLAAGIAVCIVLLPLEFARQLDIDIITRIRAALKHETRDDSWVQPLLNAIEQAAVSQSSANNSAFLQVGSIIEKYERAQIAEANRQSEALHELLGALNILREELSSLPSRIAQAIPVINASTRVKHDRAKQLIQTGELNEAVKLLEVLRNENPSPAPRGQYKQALRRVDLARSLRKINRTDEAVRFLHEAENILDELQKTLETGAKLEP